MGASAAMIGSSSMQKAGRLLRLLLTLAGLLLIPVFLIVSIGEIAGWATPEAQAADRYIINSGGGCTRNAQGPSFGGTIAVDPDEVLCGQITAFGVTVDIKGELRGNVTAFNSNVIVTGAVNGNIKLFGGTITFGNGSQIHGHIDLYAAREQSEQNIQLDGMITDHTRHGWTFAWPGEFSFPLWSLLVWLILGVVLIKLLPEHLMFARTTVATRTGRSLFLGLLSILLAPAVLVVLVALILPIPLALILALGLIAAWVLGTVAVGWIVGERILQAIAPQHNTRLIAVVVGLAVLVLVGSLPYIGWLISIGVGLLGLGAVFLSRFGTRLYGQPKNPLTL
jgi:hypothetical protein